MSHYDNIHRDNRDAIIKSRLSFLQDKALLEFGVYHGTSMLMWYDLYKSNGLSRNFIGFDSFAGLPPETEDKNTIWKTGNFSTNGVINPNLLNKEDIRLVSGFYNQSLNEHTAHLLDGCEIGIVHMDCDTYSSTKTVWQWLIKYNLLSSGTLIIYDDWGAYLEAKCGEYDVAEAKAHKEIEDTYGLKFSDIGKYVVDPSFYEVKVYQYE